MTWSKHAKRRSQQRAISTEAILAALDWGRLIRQRSGRRAYHLGRREVEAAAKAGVRLERFRGTAVVLGSDQGVITVLRTSDRRRLARGRKA